MGWMAKKGYAPWPFSLFFFDNHSKKNCLIGPLRRANQAQNLNQAISEPANIGVFALKIN